MNFTVKLRRIDDGGGAEIDLANGATTVGRGPVLKCSDTRISRNHAILTVDQSDRTLTLKSIHINPCFYLPGGKGPIEPVLKDKEIILNQGDRFSLLPTTYVYEVDIPKNNIEEPVNLNHNLKKDDEKEVKTAKKTNFESKSEVGGRTRELPKWMEQAAAKRKTDTVEPIDKKEKNGRMKRLNPRPQKQLKPSPKKRSMEISDDESDGQVEIKEDKSEDVSSKPIAGWKKKSAEISDDESSDRVKKLTPSPQKKLKPSPKKKSMEISDDESDGTAEIEDKSEEEVLSKPKQNLVANKTISPSASTSSNKRTPCSYGKNCYRKNPAHFKDCSHPGDSDYDEPKESLDDDDDDVDDRPECEFGVDCYRKNPDHRKQYKHTKRQRAATKRTARAKLKKDEDSDDDDGSDLSFVVDDDSDDYKPKPESESDTEDELKELLDDANKFKRNKNLMQPT